MMLSGEEKKCVRIAVFFCYTTAPRLLCANDEVVMRSLPTQLHSWKKQSETLNNPAGEGKIMVVKNTWLIVRSGGLSGKKYSYLWVKNLYITPPHAPYIILPFPHTLCIMYLDDTLR